MNALQLCDALKNHKTDVGKCLSVLADVLAPEVYTNLMRMAVNKSNCSFKVMEACSTALNILDASRTKVKCRALNLMDILIDYR